MGKAILAAIVTLIVGYLGMVVGLEFLGNWVEFGLLIAIAVIVTDGVFCREIAGAFCRKN